MSTKLQNRLNRLEERVGLGAKRNELARGQLAEFLASVRARNDPTEQDIKSSQEWFEREFLPSLRARGFKLNSQNGGQC